MAESFKHEISAADLKLFIVLWNQAQNQTTPDIHLKIAGWLERAWKTKKKELLLQAFRSSGKSTITGLFAAWLLYRDPSLRILVLAADHMLAKKMVRNVKRILERHPLTAHLLPEEKDQWASDRFTVKRDMELRDPSMLAKGVTSNVTGSRADVVICDDVEVPNTSDTAEKREDLRARLSEIPFVLVPGGMQLYIGTPHNYFTIYADQPRIEAGEDAPFLDGFHNLKIPILDENGESTWPERFSEKEIARKKRSSGPNLFASQMMLQPVNIADGFLDVEDLRFYDDPLDYTKEINTLFIGGKTMISASAWWDPAFGAGRGDKSVLACLFTDQDGAHYLHHVEYIDIEKFRTVDGNAGGDGVQDDEATRQCRIVCAIAKRLMLPSITVEINGIGKFLPSILRNELARAHVPTRVKEVSNTRPKDQRILEAFDAVMAARLLHVHQDVGQTPFLTEMREWRPGRSKGHDDGLDAVAGALSQEPMRITRLHGKGSFSWYGGGQSHKAKTDFDTF